MSVKTPPEMTFFVSEMQNAASIAPEELMLGEGTPTMADEVFSSLPVTEPLSDETAALGFDDMHPLAEIGTVSIMFTIQAVLIVVMFGSELCASRYGFMAADRVKGLIQGFTLWGSLIDVILLNYLPVMMTCFISLVGLQWQVINNAVILNNVWTLFILISWLLAPVFIFYHLFKNRN